MPPPAAPAGGDHASVTDLSPGTADTAVGTPGSEAVLAVTTGATSLRPAGLTAQTRNQYCVSSPSPVATKVVLVAPSVRSAGTKPAVADVMLFSTR